MTIGRWERIRGEVLDHAYASNRWLRYAVMPTDPDRLRSGGGAPVFLLPGVYETWQFLQPVAERINARGHPIHVAPGFGFNLRSIPESAAAAQRYLDTHDLRDVIIVAHSKGGLIAKQMMVTDDLDSRIQQVIAINTPFAGSAHARYALRPALREFDPAAPTITALDLERDANIRITSIFSEYDPIIPSGSRLQGATNIELPIVGHFRILSASSLFDTVERLICHQPRP